MLHVIFEKNEKSEKDAEYVIRASGPVIEGESRRFFWNMPDL